MSTWQSVFESTIFYQAEIVKTVLIDKGIQAVLLDKKDSAYPIGHFEVHVPQDQLLKAIKIVKEDVSFE